MITGPSTSLILIFYIPKRFKIKKQQGAPGVQGRTATRQKRQREEPPGWTRTFLLAIIKYQAMTIF